MDSQEALNSNQRLHFQTIRCPNCKLIWLAPGVIDGDIYVCRQCSFSFVVSKSADNPLQHSEDCSLEGEQRLNSGVRR